MLCYTCGYGIVYPSSSLVPVLSLFIISGLYVYMVVCVVYAYNLTLCRHCRYSFPHLIVLCIRCCVRATNTSVDSVNKHSIKCIACFDLHIDSVDKQDTLLNTQSFVSTISTCLHVHSNYNADSNTKSSNYSKIHFKPLIYFELQQNSN